jgi:hypothetical protein
VLRGRVVSLAGPGGVGLGAGSPLLVFEGHWAMQEEDRLWSEFRYSFKLPATAHLHQGPYLPPPGVVPVNAALPSAPLHAQIGAPMSGFFLIQDIKGPQKMTEKDVRVKFGGGGPRVEAGAPQAVYPDWRPPVPLRSAVDGTVLPPAEQVPLSAAELRTQLAGGAADSGEPVAVPPSQLVAFSGEGHNVYGRFRFEGSYHPGSGALWARKAYVPKPAPQAAGASAARAGALAGAASSADGAAADRSRGSLLGDGSVDGAAPVPAVRRGPMTGEEQLLHSFLKNLRADRANAQFFLAPVDWQALNIPDYPTIVPQPMDLGTVEQKLLNGDYRADAEAFRRDVELLCDNAVRYNGAQHVVGKAAWALLSRFRSDYDRWQQRRQKRTEDERKQKLKQAAAGAAGALGDDDEAGRQRKTAAKAAKAAAAGVGAKRERPPTEAAGVGYDADDAPDAKKRRPAAPGPVGGATKKAPPKAGGAAGGGLGGAGGAAAGGFSTEGDMRGGLAMNSENIIAIAELVARTLNAQQMITAAASNGALNIAGLGGQAGDANAVLPAVISSILLQQQMQQQQQQQQPARTAPMPPPPKKAPQPAKSAKAAPPARAAAPPPPPRGRAGPAAAGDASRVPSVAMAGGGPAPIVHAAVVRLTEDEKVQLSEDIGLLQQEQIDAVVNFLQSRAGLEMQEGQLELDIDIDNLDTATQRELQKFAARSLGRPVPAHAMQFRGDLNGFAPGAANNTLADTRMAAERTQRDFAGVGGPGALTMPPRPMAPAAPLAPPPPPPPPPVYGAMADDDDDIPSAPSY